MTEDQAPHAIDAPEPGQLDLPGQLDPEVDDSEQSSLEEPPEEEPSAVFDAANNSPARQNRDGDPSSDSGPSPVGDPSAPTEPVDLTRGGSGTFIVGG